MGTVYACECMGMYVCMIGSTCVFMCIFVCVSVGGEDREQEEDVSVGGEGDFETGTLTHLCCFKSYFTVKGWGLYLFGVVLLRHTQQCSGAQTVQGIMYALLHTKQFSSLVPIIHPVLDLVHVCSVPHVLVFQPHYGDYIWCVQV